MIGTGGITREQLDELAKRLRDVAEVGEAAQRLCGSSIVSHAAAKTLAIALPIAAVLTPQTTARMQELARALLTWRLD